MLCGGNGDDKEKDPLADTNMEMYTSDLAKSVRKAAADTEKAWKGAGKKEGMEIWRIENFGVKRWPKDKYGSFFSGDSYICLQTYKPDPESPDLDYNVFFWLGKTTTQDEYGTAAYKTVELDDKLGGEPVQFREVQGQESDEFLEAFPAMTIMEGGIASAFNKVEPEAYKPRLFLVMGNKKKNVKSYQVDLNVDSLSMDNCYVLDLGENIIVATFDKSSFWEKRKANEIADNLQKERGSEDWRIDSFGEDSDAAIKFWEAFGGKPDSISDTYTPAAPPKIDPAVYMVSDIAGSSDPSCTKMASEPNDDGKFDKDILRSDNVMVIDSGKTVFIWVGKDASASERKMAMPLVLEANPGFNTRPMKKEKEGSECKAFRALFA